MKSWSILLFLLVSYCSSAQISMTVECDGSGNIDKLHEWLQNNGGATNPDGCSPIIWTNDFAGLSDNCGETGSTTVTFTATDDCGLEVSSTATFTIEDTTTPIIYTPAVDENVECDGAGNTAELQAWLDNNGGATASDECSEVTWTNDFSGVIKECGEAGYTNVTFTATDDCGLFSTTYAEFRIEDWTPPDVTDAIDETAEGNGEDNQTLLDMWLANNGGATASDVCSGVDWTHDFDPFSEEWLQTGSVTVTFTATDACGSFSTTSARFSAKENLQVEVEISDDDCQPGDTEIIFTVNEGTAPYTISWTTNSGGTVDSGNLIIDAEGESTSYAGMIAYQEYFFVVTDSNGNEAELSYTPGVTAPYELATPSLCMVTSDPMTGHYNILWEDSPVMNHITQYNIYREGNATGAYELVGSVAVEEENRYVDTSGDPSVQAYKYRLTASDECGLESPASNIHKTIHLVINQGLNSNINLEWDTYEGLNYDQVIIYRGTSAQNMEELITLPSTVGSFTDTEAPTGMLFYQIVLPQTVECEIGKAPFSVRSNVAELGEETSKTNNLSFEVKAYPNPIDDKLYILTEEAINARLVNINGQVLIEKELNKGKNFLNTLNLQAGSYLLHLTNGAENYSQKVIK